MPGSPKENPSVASFVGRVSASLRRLGVWRRTTLLAVSGGADSLALLEAIARSAGGEGVEVACVDHGLRDVRAEVDLVEARATAHRLHFHAPKLSLAPGPGVEARARALRYEALLRLKRERGLDVVLTGHTASDQAETLLSRLVRGTSLAGAAGIHEHRADGVVRPLLFATREETHAYVRALGLDAAKDPMNEDPAFLRVRLRAEVLPALSRAAGHEVAPALARFSALAAEDDAWITAAAERAFERVSLSGALDQVALTALERPLRRRVLALFLARAGVAVDADAIEDALSAIAEGRRGTLPGDRVLTCLEGLVEVVAAPPRGLHTSSLVPDGRDVGR